MLILTAEEVRRALPMPEAIQAMKLAYSALSGGRAQVPLRIHLTIPPHDAASLFMPAFVQAGDEDALAVKVVSLFPGNVARGLAFIQAAVLVLESDTGRAAALLEGASLTAIRTGAASGAAADVLSRPESRVAAIYGAGAQARTQLEAVCAIRTIETAWVFDRNRDKAIALASEMGGRAGVPLDIRVAEDPAQAAATADIICTATTSTTAVFSDRDLKPGTHICAIGSYTAEMQEVPAETIARAKVVVDSRAACLAEAGDLIKPLMQGLISEQHIHAEIGEILLGMKAGRESAEEITCFKSVGLAVQDAMAAQFALRNARRLGLGISVEFG